MGIVLQGLIGPIMGIVGSIATSITNYKIKQLEIKEKELDRAHQLAMIEATTKATIAETEANIKVAQITYEGQVDIEEAKAFTVSQKEGNKRNLDAGIIESMFNRGQIMSFFAGFLTVGLGLCDVFKGLMRPFLTIYMVFLASWTTYECYDIMQGLDKSNFDPESIRQEWKETGIFIWNMASALVMWWYGDRRIAKSIKSKQS